MKKQYLIITLVVIFIVIALVIYFIMRTNAKEAPITKTTTSSGLGNIFANTPSDTVSALISQLGK